MSGEQSNAARFRPGDLVRVDHRIPEGHCRTPAYLRGRVGRVERVLGAFRNPEELAYYKAAGLQPLYWVSFAQAELWPGYAGSMQDRLAADIYEHWLEPAEGDAP